MTRTQRNRLRAIILAFCFSASMGVAAGQSVPLVSFPFSLSGVGVGPQIPLQGQSSCAIVLSNAGTGLTLIPQASSDQGATWVTASTIGSGSISTIGSYVGGIAGTGLTNFRFIVSALSSGTVSGQETCSGAVGSETISGGTVTAIQPTASLLNATVVFPSPQPVTGTFFQAVQPVSCSAGSVCPTNATLQAGSAIAGKFGIDQTTPGTTNGVQVNAALPAGTNAIGSITNTSFAATQGTSPWVVSGTVTANAGTGFPTVPVDPCASASATIPTVPINTGAGTTVVITHSGTTSTYICGTSLIIRDASAEGTGILQAGTGTTCGTGTANLIQWIQQAASTQISPLTLPLGLHTYFSAGNGVDICLNVSGTGAAVTGDVWYKQV